MMRNRLISSIEIVGLGVGMSVGLMIIIIISSQREYDKFHPHTDRTFRITTDVTDDRGIRPYATTPLKFARFIEEYPTVSDVVTVAPVNITIQIDNKNIERSISLTGPSFFEVLREFTYRTNLGADIVLGSIITMVAGALAIIVLLVSRTAAMNPADVIKSA